MKIPIVWNLVAVIESPEKVPSLVESLFNFFGMILAGLLIILVVLLPLAFLTSVCAIWRQRRRPKLLTQAAERLGLEFHEESGACSQEDFSASWGDAVTKNVIHGSWKAGDLLIFDRHPGENSGFVVKRTLAAFRCGKRLPRFELRPGSVINKVRSGGQELFGSMTMGDQGRQIAFESQPEFSAQYLLTGYGQDELDIRSVFNPEVLQFLEQLDKSKKWSVESSFGWLLVYSDNANFGSRWKLMGIDLEEAGLVSPGDLRAFLEQVTMIAERFS